MKPLDRAHADGAVKSFLDMCMLPVEVLCMERHAWTEVKRRLLHDQIENVNIRFGSVRRILWMLRDPIYIYIYISYMVMLMYIRTSADGHCFHSRLGTIRLSWSRSFSGAITSISTAPIMYAVSIVHKLKSIIRMIMYCIRMYRFWPFSRHSDLFRY